VVDYKTLTIVYLQKKTERTYGEKRMQERAITIQIAQEKYFKFLTNH
jgi:hypothetical protein